MSRNGKRNASVSENTPLTVTEGDSENEEERPICYLPYCEGPYPKCVFFILGNEFCERYSYYGMRTILVLYLKYYLLFSEDSSTAIYHAFTVLAYLFPLMGAFIADSWLGKYKTILYLSFVYAFGMILNTLGAIPVLGAHTMHVVLSMVGLFVIAVGTGGIKPCVSAFGGDQFTPEQDNYRRSFFSLFYFAINAGSLVSTIVSPIIRDDVSCFGDDCYALAFGIPAVLMIVAIVMFVIGTPFYIIKAPEGNIFAEVFRGMGSAIKHRWNTARNKRTEDHWMDYALVDTSAKLVRDTKYVLRVLILYIPLPLFWTLFDQQGSRWTLQATRMNGYVGSIRVKPDQMQVFNPLLIVTLIPLFEATLYPCLRHFKINFSPLKRMSLGMILAGISFVIAAFVQLEMDKTLTIIPDANEEVSFRVINGANCKLTFYSEIYPEWSLTGPNGGPGMVLEPGEATNTLSRFVDESKVGRTYDVFYHCVGESGSGKSNITLKRKSTQNMVVSNDGGVWKSKNFDGIFDKAEGGEAIVRVFNALEYRVIVKGLGADMNISSNSIGIASHLERNDFTMKIYDEANEEYVGNATNYLDTGGDYTYLIWDNGTSEEERPETMLYTDVNPNDVNLFWMIPQYFVITLGEVFLSVTGLEFSYSQAPTSMKSVLASFWLLTVSLGNIIVLIIAEAQFVPSQADEYFLFAGLIGIAVIVFIGLSIRYKYVDESEFYETEHDRLDARGETTFADKIDEDSDDDNDVKKKSGKGEVNGALENIYATADDNDVKKKSEKGEVNGALENDYATAF